MRLCRLLSWGTFVGLAHGSEVQCSPPTHPTAACGHLAPSTWCPAGRESSCRLGSASQRRAAHGTSLESTADQTWLESALCCPRSWSCWSQRGTSGRIRCCSASPARGIPPACLAAWHPKTRMRPPRCLTCFAKSDVCQPEAIRTGRCGCWATVLCFSMWAALGSLPEAAVACRTGWTEPCFPRHPPPSCWCRPRTCPHSRVWAGCLACCRLVLASSFCLLDQSQASRHPSCEHRWLPADSVSWWWRPLEWASLPTTILAFQRVWCGVGTRSGCVEKRMMCSTLLILTLRYETAPLFPETLPLQAAVSWVAGVSMSPLLWCLPWTRCDVFCQTTTLCLPSPLSSRLEMPADWFCSLSLRLNRHFDSSCQRSTAKPDCWNFCQHGYMLNTTHRPYFATLPDFACLRFVFFQVGDDFWIHNLMAFSKVSVDILQVLCEFLL